MNENSIGQEIVILRAKKGWTQLQLAEAIGTSQRTVASWESEESVPRKAMLVKIALSFDLPANYFLKENGNEGSVEPTSDLEKSSTVGSEKILAGIENLLLEDGYRVDPGTKDTIMNNIKTILQSSSEVIHK
ncbi:MAG: helix-turn-helix domain-containing protein [Lachnospiraceae bacterium]|nr:helix-turn-helix domain-containing protein [Lachnospiraceae bacterium]